MTTPIDAIDIITVIAITAFAGGTSFVGAIISKKIKFSEQQILSLTAFGAGILISAAIFEMVIEAEKGIGIMLTLFSIYCRINNFYYCRYCRRKERWWSRNTSWYWT
jgi:hypothetical protein